MVQVFATKVWGLDFDYWPLLTFPTDGYRKSFIKRTAENDLVCLVATKGNNTSLENKGRILGLVECGSALVNAESILLEINNGRPLPDRNYENGHFKWPFGISLKQAWYFPEKPIAAETIGNLDWSSVRGCQLLSNVDANRILRLKRVDAHLRDIGLFVPAARPEQAPRSPLTGTGPALGVPPAVSGYQVTRTKTTSFVYVLKFQNTDIFKVGWAFDVEARAKDINQHIPTEILDQQWEIFLWRKYDNQFLAYEAEQRLLQGDLKKYRTIGERVKIAEKALRDIWAKFDA